MPVRKSTGSQKGFPNKPSADQGSWTTHYDFSKKTPPAL